MALDFDRSILGQVFDTTDFPPVTKEEILNFAAALGETNPLYTDEAAAAQSPYGGLVAPPTFVTKLRAKKFTPEHLPRFGKLGFDCLALCNIRDRARHPIGLAIGMTARLPSGTEPAVVAGL